MTFEIGLILLILALAVFSFVTDLLRPDLVALLVLSTLAVSGLVSPAEALSGFSSPAVIAIWAMFIISGGLAVTGVADQLGALVMRLAGRSEAGLLTVIMLAAALLSAFMNSVSVVALLLPVVIVVARKTGHPPSRLLIPLAYASLLGGLTTLVGTSTNLLVSETLRENGLTPFNLFDFSPVGVPVMLAGTAFMVFIGRHLLPRQAPDQAARTRDLSAFYNLNERLQVLRVPAGSALAGRTLAESRLGGLLGLNVIGILRRGQAHLAPDPNLVLEADDRLLVVGKATRLDEIRQRRLLSIFPAAMPAEQMAAAGLGMAQLTVRPGSRLDGQTLARAGLRREFGLNVLALLRNAHVEKENLGEAILHAGDRLVVLGTAGRVEALAGQTEFDVSEPPPAALAYLAELVRVQIPAGSSLVGKTLAETHLGDSADLTILGRLDGEQLGGIPARNEPLQADDVLLAHIGRESLAAWSNVATLEIDETPLSSFALETEKVGFVEATLSPYATIEGKTLRELHFRQKYGLTAVAIWRGGRAHRNRVRDRPLHMGDGLLLYGPRSAWPVVASDPNFIVLEMDVKPPPRRHKAWLALAILVLVMVPVLLNWLTLAIAAVIGAALMVVTGCLTMDEAYRNIEWKAVFLIGGMLPLGIAMETSQTAALIANSLIALLGSYGGAAVLFGLFLLTHLLGQLIPSAVVVVLMAPIGLQAAAGLGASPHTFMIALALAAASSMLSPVSHPANVLVMGPGGYRFSDYIKVGLPLTLVVILLAVLLIPLFWPL